MFFTVLRREFGLGTRLLFELLFQAFIPSVLRTTLGTDAEGAVGGDELATYQTKPPASGVTNAVGSPRSYGAVVSHDEIKIE